MNISKMQIRSGFLTGLIMTVIIWWLVSLIVNKAILPAPQLAFVTLFEMLTSADVYYDIFISTIRVLVALFLAFMIGFPLGLLSGINRTADFFISPLLYFFFPLPKIVFLPVFFVLFGINETTRILLLVFIVVFQIIVNIRDGIRQIDPEYQELFFTMGAGRTDYLKMYVQFVMPAFFTALRISLGMVIAVLFISENFIADRGLGFLIFQSLELRNYPEMYSAIIMMSLLGYVLYALTDFFERKVCFWHKSMLE